MLPVASLQLRVSSFGLPNCYLLKINVAGNKISNLTSLRACGVCGMRRRRVACGVWHVPRGQAGQAGSSVCSNRPTMSTKSPRHCGRCCCHAPITVAAHTHTAPTHIQTVRQTPPHGAHMPRGRKVLGQGQGQAAGQPGEISG